MSLKKLACAIFLCSFSSPGFCGEDSVRAEKGAEEAVASAGWLDDQIALRKGDLALGNFYEEEPGALIPIPACRSALSQPEAWVSLMPNFERYLVASGGYFLHRLELYPSKDKPTHWRLVTFDENVAGERFLGEMADRPIFNVGVDCVRVK